MKLWTSIDEGRRKQLGFLGGLVFTALLNVADFVSDWWVVLGYGCIFDTKLSTECGPGDATGMQETCQVHPWWFGIGLFLLIASNLFQSAVWTYWAVGIDNGILYNFVRQPETCCGFLAVCFVCFVLAFLQFHYMVDIAVAVRLGAPEETDDARTDSIIARELATKILETIPQLYMQSYILFVTGTHGDPIKVTSIAISVLALSHGMLKAVGMDPDQKALKKLPFRFVSFLFLASDQAMRSAAFSLVLSQEVRPFGVTLMAVAAVATCGTYVWTAKAGDDLGEKVVFAFVFFFTIYLIPVWMWGDNDDELLGTVRGVRIRWLEMLLCAVLAYLVAKTNCGHAPSHEVAGLVGLLAFNLATYALMRSCFNWRTGDFRFQSTLEDWYRCITGCWTKGKAEDDEANALTAEDSDGNDEVSKVEPEAEPHEAEPNEKPEMVTTNESDDGAKTKPKRRVWKNLKRKPKSVANQKEGEEVVQRTLASLDAEEEDPTSGGDLQIDVEDQADLPQLPKEEKKKVKKGKKGKARGTKARSSTSPEAYMVGRGLEEDHR